MIIHTVKAEDTIFRIAREYSVQPTKILEDNGLCQDRLVEGQELIILTPTRTVTARGSDTVSSVAKRFGVKNSQVIRNNPKLASTRSLRPGHILSIKYDAPIFGVGSLVGFFDKGCTSSQLSQTLPYLTYAVAECAKITEDGVRADPPYDRIKLIKEQGKIPLLGIMDLCGGCVPHNRRISIAEEAASLARASGAMGICINTRSGNHVDHKELGEYLTLQRKALMGYGLMLMIRSDSKLPGKLCGIGDISVIDASLTEDELRAAAEDQDKSDAFIMLDTRAKMTTDGEGTVSMLISDAVRLAYLRKIKIEEDKRTGNLYYNFTRYIGGRGIGATVSYPSLKKIKTRMAACATLGYLGLGVNISSVPVSYLSMFNAGFQRADYSPLPSAAT